MEQPRRHRRMRWRLHGGTRRRWSTRRRVSIVVAAALAFFMMLGGTAFAQFTGPPGVTITPGGENCNGVIPTPGSENTVKTLIGGTLVPGGTAIYRIAYPVDPSTIGDEWEIVDCVLIGSGTDLKDYEVLDEATFSGVINSTAFVLDFTFNIPADALIGDSICNVAKTTEGPSAPQASNRKAGPACFIIGGDARIEKHSTTDPDGDPIPGATFTIGNCVNTALDPAIQPLIINGVSYANPLLAPYAGHGTITIVATTGVITFSGATGSHCDVTETIPPPGYGLPADVTQTVTIDAGEQNVVVFLDPPAPGAIQITKVAPAGASGTTFDFTITCTNPANVYTTSITGSGTATVSDVPAGSSCTVTEDDAGSEFNPPLISPSGAFIVGSNQTVLVTVTNTFAPGAIQITKVAPASESDTVFNFTITCTNPANVYTAQITGSGVTTVTGIPAGSSCTVTEDPLSSSFATPVIVPSGAFTVGAGQTVAVLVTNALAPGNLTISKTSPAGTSFTFDIACTNPTNDYELVVPANGSATQTGIPAGSICTVTEQVPVGFATPVYTPGQTVTILPGATVTVSVTNSLLPLGLTVVKTADPISGEPGDAVTYTYVVTNTGEVTLFDISVDDDKLGHIGDIDELAPGESATLTKTTTLPSAAGLLTNVATAVGTDEFGRTASDTDDATVTVVLAVRPVAPPAPLPETGTHTGLLLLVGTALVMLGVAMRLAGRVHLVPVTASSVAGRRVMAQAYAWFRPIRRGHARRRRPPDRAGP